MTEPVPVPPLLSQLDRCEREAVANSLDALEPFGEPLVRRGVAEPRSRRLPSLSTLR